MAETDARKPFVVWRAYRLIGNIFIHGRKQRYDTYHESLMAYLSLTHIPGKRKYLDVDNCRDASYRDDYTGQLVTISPMVLKPAHRRMGNQLQIASGGAGCKPGAWSAPVHCESLRYGHKSTWERQDILGIVRPDALPRWAKQRLRTRNEKR